MLTASENVTPEIPPTCSIKYDHYFLNLCLPTPFFFASFTIPSPRLMQPEYGIQTWPLCLRSVVVEQQPATLIHEVEENSHSNG
ncbi:unnamed protein product [Protopolystoma xenopodis]|uniref:Uncharacterized protein n=1 Tax=Protopolystoma xenopodis TaxID=117903 RepID=A0A448WLF7_9PLAT|nr:unnamed protein product [Protopolystoma xenopodis]